MSEMIVREGVDLTPLNTFGIRAKAKFFVEVQATEQLVALTLPGVFSGPKLVLGGGSNLLFTRDYPGLIVQISIPGIRVIQESGDELEIAVGAGINWHTLVMHAVAKGWGGLENLALIPGRVGAAPVQNIGAYGVELKDVFVSLEAVDLATGAHKTFLPQDCLFGYRDSFFKHNRQWVITEVRFRLHRTAPPHTHYASLAEALQGIPQPTIAQVAEAVIRIRRSKLPDPAEIGNAGSFFKNPTVPAAQAEVLHTSNPTLPLWPQPAGAFKLPAAWLIEQTGWKGYRSGAVGVHPRQALVLVNYGGGNGAEVLALAHQIQTSVQDKFGIALEMEVNVV